MAVFAVLLQCKLPLLQKIRRYLPKVSRLTPSLGWIKIKGLLLR